MFTELGVLRDALADTTGVVSCKIGIERNISPADYPMIRLVPVRVTAGQPYNQRTCEVGVYFGMNTSASEGLEEVYSDLFGLEAEIIQIIKSEGGKYIETLTDEDRLDTYKLMFIRCEIIAARPT